MDKKNLWNLFLNNIKQQLSPIAFDTWFAETELYDLTETTAKVIVPMHIHKKNLKENYNDLVEDIFTEVSGSNFKFEYYLKEEIESNITIDTDTIGVPHTNNFETNLNPQYTFDNFIIGESNKFAHATALAVAENPGYMYNPLFIYGNSGLGKTHLMHAIGNRILENNNKKNVLYVTSEKFTNQLINAIKDNKNEFFRNKYRNIDVLLIDDIQFIAGKERVQEEFFHTFNDLHSAGKQVIISSDKPPKDMETLEDRIRSRFEWGLIADISNPDYETRLAILRKKAQLDNIIIDDEILSNIANRIDSNIRELEGTLNKLIAKSSLTNSPITMEMTQKAINDIVAKQDKVISSEYIQDVVRKYFSVSPADLRGAKRSNDVTFPRQIAMYLCRNVAQMSLPQIGIDFGKRDHTTVMHACNKIEKEIKTNSNTRLIVESVQKILLSDK